MITRDEAFALLKEYIESDSLIKHCLAVEASMREYAQKFNEDLELWGITGLLHDIDFEKYPEEQHPLKGAEILSDKGLPKEVIEAVKAHNDALNIKRETRLAKTLFAVDGLSSFVIAYVLVRPDNSFEGIKVKSIKKKLKDKAFAKGVDREMIQKGLEEMELDLSEHIETVVNGIEKREKELNEMGLSLI